MKTVEQISPVQIREVRSGFSTFRFYLLCFLLNSSNRNNVKCNMFSVVDSEKSI